MIETALFAQVGFFLMIAVAFGCSRSASLFHPLTFYLFVHFIVFTLRPVMVHYLGFDGRWVYMHYRPSDDEFMFTLLVSSIGLFVFAVVCWAAARAEPRFSEEPLMEFSAAQTKALLWTWVLLGPLAIYSAFFAVQPTGVYEKGEIQMTQDLVTGNTIFVNTTGYIVDAQTMLGPLAVLAMWRFRFALWTWILPLAFIIYRTILGSRWLIVAMAFTLILIHLYRHRKKWFQVRFAVVLLPLFILFQNMGADRNYFREMLMGAEAKTVVAAQYRDDRTWLQKQDNPDFANFEFLAFLLWVVPNRSLTYTYFSQYLQLFTEPIPRMLWPDKPVGPPITLVQLNSFGNFVGLTNSLVGDGWMSMGWAGVITTMTLIGAFLGWMHRNFWRRIDHAPSVILYCTFLPLTVTWFRDGGISIFKYALFTIVPIMTWRGIARMFERVGR